MKSKKVRRLSLATAGVVGALIIFHAGLGLANSSIPVPERKPEIVKNADVHKQGNLHAALNPEDEELYRKIFHEQEKGNITQADAYIAQVDNKILMGHVLAQRYLHPTATKAQFDDLNAWMSKYSDHPQAKRIYDLGLKRMPAGYKGKLAPPQTSQTIHGIAGVVSRQGKSYKPRITRSEDQEALVRDLHARIKKHVQIYEPSQALQILNDDPARAYLDEVEYNRERATIAAGYLYAGKLDEAIRLAAQASSHAPELVPMAGWVSGLAYWQKEHYKKSAKAFEQTALSAYSSGWMMTGAAYWASRAHMRAGNVKVVSKWLEIAAKYPRTFYGLIATRALGQDSDFNWLMPDISKDQAKDIEKTSIGKRTKALISIGQLHLAEEELKQLYKKGDNKTNAALIAYAYQNNLASLSMKLGHAVKKDDSGVYDAALYPVVPWEPEDGYKVDKALLHAFIRQESQFDVFAQSPNGAMGLMQLIPSTASFVSGDGDYSTKDGQVALQNPERNMRIGQKYLLSLLNNKDVGQDLLSLSIAYNAGPGNLAKWKAERKHMDDPLLFIETIPFSETRAFVERILSNYWIYRLQFNQPAPTLDAVAEGRWARYASIDEGLINVADNH